ncbi:MAG: 2-oxoacid:ferredoxin oxidoreductase subunit beta [Spirochaetota bacterium]
MAVTDYLRKRFMPHIWCPGCGHGIVLNSLLRAVEKLGLAKNDIVMISGIGCSARMQGYVDFHTLHTLHGRALAFATGIKMAWPLLNVIVPMGDGDALAIGGNHFIHAARRNIDVTAIIMNNSIYGMTGGQYSPLTACGDLATTAPYGTVDPPFDTVRLAESAGASFIARTTTWHARDMTKILAKAMTHKGFSVVEVLSQCPTYYGRKNDAGDAVAMMEFYRDNTVRVDRDGDAAAPAGGDGAREEPIPIGIFRQEERSEYCESYRTRVMEPAARSAGAEPPAPQDALAPTECEEPES